MAIGKILFRVSLLKYILFINITKYVKEEKLTFVEFYYIPPAFDISSQILLLPL